MSYVIEDSGLSAEKEAELNAVLAPLNAELSSEGRVSATVPA